MSYEIFLVHHIIIYYMGDILIGQNLKLRHVIALFLTEVFIMVAMGITVKKMSARVRAIKLKKAIEDR